MLKSKVPMFSAEEYDDWKIMMQTHLLAMNNEIQERHLRSLTIDLLKYSMKWNHWEKKYSQREKNLKVINALPHEWDMKVVAMRESKDLYKITTFELFSYLKAYEFDIDRRRDEETSTSKVTTPVVQHCCRV
ncbi:hypothetical protein ACS0TY_029097 [Phlomoides rotata]